MSEEQNIYSKEAERNTDITSATESEKEKKYKTLDNIRFEEGINENTVTTILESYSKHPHESMITDDATFFDHVVVGGTVYPMNRPLTPFSVILGGKKPEEIIKTGKRERGAAPYSFFELNPDANKFISAQESGQRFDLQIDHSVKDDFFKFIREKLKDLPPEDRRMKVFIKFKVPLFDPKTNNIILPNIDKISFISGRDEIIPDNLAKGIKMKQMLYRTAEDYYLYIDQEGLRVDKKQN